MFRREYDESSPYRVMKTLRLSITELSWLAENEGPVTPGRWAALQGCSTDAAARFLQRMEASLTRIGIPYEVIDVAIVMNCSGDSCYGTSRGVVPMVGRWELEKYFLKPGRKSPKIED